MTERKTYRAVCERDGSWWFIQVPGVAGAFTQARRLDQVEVMTRDVVALLLEVDPASFDVFVEPVVPEPVRRSLDVARTLREDAERKQAQAARQTRDAARALADSGYTFRDVGAVLGVSYQRVAQLLASSKGKPLRKALFSS